MFVVAMLQIEEKVKEDKTRSQATICQFLWHKFQSDFYSECPHSPAVKPYYSTIANN